MSNSDETPKQNGFSGDPLQRLASFKAPRDLSLGGVKPNKKVFTPNLNVARNKNKGPSANNRDHKKEEKNRKERKNDRNKNIRNGPNIIKSSGVFSEGLGSSERHTSRGSYSRDSDSAATLQRPTIRIKDVVKIDKESEEKKIRCVVDDGFNENDASEDFKQWLQINAPTKLPMDDGSWSNKTKAAVKVKEEVIVKQEPDDEGAIIVERKPLPDVKKEVFENTDVVNLLRSDKPTLILLQLPDTLPGRGGSVDDDPPRRKPDENPSTSTSTTEPKADEPVDNRCYLSDLEEGKIGKILVRRSGRASLALGDTVFDVCLGTRPAFHQEVVSLAVDDTSRSANLIAIGPLHHKINLVPQWENMFKDMPI